MSNSTRSRASLTGDIREYCLTESRKNTVTDKTKTDKMGDEERNAQRAMEALAADPVKLMQMLALSVTNTNNTRTQANTVKLEVCPVKRKNCSLDAWLTKVELWDESNNSGDKKTLNTKKYLSFMESIRNSEEDDDLKNVAHVEFVENKDFDKKAEDVIAAMIKTIKEKLGISDLEKCSNVWKEFINIKKKPTKSVKEFVTRFEQTETKMKNVNIKIPDKVLAIHLMMKSNMETQSKENVLTKTNVSD